MNNLSLSKVSHSTSVSQQLFLRINGRLISLKNVDDLQRLKMTRQLIERMQCISNWNTFFTKFIFDIQLKYCRQSVSMNQLNCIDEAVDGGLEYLKCGLEMAFDRYYHHRWTSNFIQLDDTTVTWTLSSKTLSPNMLTDNMLICFAPNIHQ